MITCSVVASVVLAVLVAAVPCGGSNPLGSLGYVACMHEVAEQAKLLGVRFRPHRLRDGLGGHRRQYLEALDAASGRVSVEEVGRTTLGRPFVLVTVTSEANAARLEEIRQANARIADPRGLGEAEAERLVREGKAIVAMAFSIHSTEVGGTLASLRLLHHLASSDDDRVRAMLDETVLLLLPSHNPDGTDLVGAAFVLSEVEVAAIRENITKGPD